MRISCGPLTLYSLSLQGEGKLDGGSAAPQNARE